MIIIGGRTISFTRKYDLKNFNNMDIGDSFIEIPPEHALNQKLVEKLMLLQMLTVEWAHRRYIEIRKKYATEDPLKTLEEQLTELEADRDRVFLEIKTLLKEEKPDETDIT